MERMNIRVEKDNGRAVGIDKGRLWKVWRFSSNKFWNNIGCLIFDPNFGLGGSRIWEEVEETDKWKEREDILY